MLKKPPFLLSLALLGIAAVVATTAAAAADDVPVVFAVDASRSLSTADLALVAESVAATAAALPPEIPTGLVVFADQPRWIAKPAPANDLGAALRGLRPEGNFTLLHDGLFAAMEELPRGGVVVLLTDGRDENSATTIDDLALRAGERGVRIVALGVGRAQDERTLRRLAVVSGGAYAGSLAAAAPADLATIVSASVRAIAAAHAEEAATRSAATAAAETSSQPAQPAGVTTAPAPSTAEPPAATAALLAGVAGVAGVAGAAPRFPAWLWPALALAILAAAAAGFLARRNRVPRPAECPRCGTQLPAGETGECAACREITIVEQLRTRPVAGPDHALDAFLETASVPQISLEERLEHTFVMIEQPTLIVQEHGEPPRSFALPADKAFSIGREPGRNTLAIPSVTLSSEHFRLVPEGDGYYLLDMKSTNGTILNSKRVQAARLAPGDVIRAGQVEFQYVVQQVQSGRRPRRPAAARAAS